MSDSTILVLSVLQALNIMPFVFSSVTVSNCVCKGVAMLESHLFLIFSLAVN